MFAPQINPTANRGGENNSACLNFKAGPDPAFLRSGRSARWARVYDQKLYREDCGGEGCRGFREVGACVGGPTARTGPGTVSSPVKGAKLTLAGPAGSESRTLLDGGSPLKYEVWNIILIMKRDVGGVGALAPEKTHYCVSPNQTGLQKCKTTCQGQVELLKVESG